MSWLEGGGWWLIALFGLVLNLRALFLYRRLFRMMEELQRRELVVRAFHARVRPEIIEALDSGELTEEQMQELLRATEGVEL